MALAAALVALSLSAAPAPAPQSFDSAYADAATAALVARARRRHLEQDTLVHDYHALLRTRVDASLGRSRFARIFPLVAFEQIARLHWSRPNDLRVELIGRRARTPSRSVRAGIDWDEPWFFPRGVGDSIRLFGEGLPEHAALHPFAAGAEPFYHFAIVDSLSVRLPDHTIETVTLEVRPRRPAAALIAGRVTLDRESGEVIRMTFLFVGDRLWVSPEEVDRDSAKAARINRLANQALRVEADIEYALFAERYWMPFRQLITLEAEDRWITGAVVPVRMVTEFRDYEINVDRPVAFSLELPDTANERRWVDTTGRGPVAEVRTGRSSQGRWEIARPPRDTLDRYDGWTDSLTLDAQPGDERRLREMGEELARLAEDLPRELTGRGGGLGFVRYGEVFRFNRVQGLSLGGTYAWQPGLKFTTLLVSGRFGFSDERLLANVSARRDAPSGVLEVSVSRALRDVDPFSSGLSLANSVTALFTGHDDADYVLATGARLSFTRPLGRRWEWTARLGVERHESVATEAGSRLHDWFFGDGLFPPNPPVRERTELVAGTMFDAAGSGLHLRLGADGLADRGLAVGRAWGELRAAVGPVRLSLLGGGASRDDVPQLLLRAGGPRTVRGHDFGVRAGQVMWAAQVELVLPVRRRLFRPVLFADAGSAGSFAAVARGVPLVGVGAGLSAHLLVAELRLEVSKAVGCCDRPAARFDLVFRPTR